MKTWPYEYVEFVLVYLAEKRSSISFLHMQIRGPKKKRVHLNGAVLGDWLDILFFFPTF